jgi:hypothetical protein
MQVLTSSQHQDDHGATLPPWDKVKKIFRLVCEFIKRTPVREDDLTKLLTKDQLSTLYAATGVSQNNSNKFLSTACLGEDFMALYDKVNDMHMQCKFF